MNAFPDGGEIPLSSPRTYSADEVNMDLTMCGLLPERAAELAQLYREHGNWNEVKKIWFEERRANRSTKGSSQKIYRVLTSRFKNSPTGLPNPHDIPVILEACTTPQDSAQALYPYLVADDALVHYVVREYVQRLSGEYPDPLDFSNETLTTILSRLEYEDGTTFDYAESTTKRWCEGFRSVMREIGVLKSQQTVVGAPPSLGEIPLLVAMGYSWRNDGEEWLESPLGLQYLFQPSERWPELYDRAADTDTWEYVELHGSLQLRPTKEPHSWIAQTEREL